ncbi:bone morphogenetic protein 2-like [Uloborus diversus]|uniref:bone morphogenetic protein 2-like n=1 Tax=Uloborus diversus TaxID=327109 RepID=UPI00240A3B10|nr:bone morphogenetic protein 2-like [Uloborus diversus]
MVPPSSAKTLPPQYMVDLYRTLADGTYSEQKIRHHGANTARSFFNKGSSEAVDRFRFEISDAVPNREEIVDAEFHFFIHFEARWKHSKGHFVQIQLFEGNQDRLLESRLVSAYSSGWEVFRIIDSVRRWIAQPARNQGLKVQVLDSSGKIWKQQRVYQLQSFQKSILIVFSKDVHASTIHSSSLTLNGELNNYHEGTPIHENSIESIEKTSPSRREHNITRRTRSAVQNSQCARHELKVDFEKLGWSMWIISPKWYNAYICAGACAFPLGQNQRPTNHATIQSIVHELGLASEVEAPCCVPTELHPVSLLYFDEHMNVVLKQYEDMIAVGCGCQ